MRGCELPAAGSGQDLIGQLTAAFVEPLAAAVTEGTSAMLDAAPDRHGFTFTRTTTIGLGGSTCPFHFQRTRAARS